MLADGTRLTLAWHGESSLGSPGKGITAGTVLAPGWDSESALGSPGKRSIGTRQALGWDGGSGSMSLPTTDSRLAPAGALGCAACEAPKGFATLLSF